MKYLIVPLFVPVFPSSQLMQPTRILTNNPEQRTLRQLTNNNSRHITINNNKHNRPIINKLGTGNKPVMDNIHDGTKVDSCNKKALKNFKPFLLYRSTLRLYTNNKTLEHCIKFYRERTG